MSSHELTFVPNFHWDQTGLQRQDDDFPDGASQLSYETGSCPSDNRSKEDDLMPTTPNSAVNKPSTPPSRSSAYLRNFDHFLRHQETQISPSSSVYLARPDTARPQTRKGGHRSDTLSPTRFTQLASSSVAPPAPPATPATSPKKKTFCYKMRGIFKTTAWKREEMARLTAEGRPIPSTIYVPDPTMMPPLPPRPSVFEPIIRAFTPPPQPPRRDLTDKERFCLVTPRSKYYPNVNRPE